MLASAGADGVLDGRLPNLGIDGVGDNDAASAELLFLFLLFFQDC